MSDVFISYARSTAAEARRTAVEFFREAARLDPQFALAFAGLADVLVELAHRRMGDPAARGHPRFEAMLQRMS